MLTEITSRIASLFRRRRMEADLEQELESHLDMLTEENIRRGQSPEEARRAAHARVGGLTALKEQHREIRGLPMLETIWRDGRFALRLIAKDKWFAGAAVAALALGIGVNAVGFTIVNTAFLRGLPVTDSHELFTACWMGPQGELCNASPVEIEEWRAAHAAMAALAAYSEDTVNISDDRSFPEQVNGAFVSANLFGVLGLRPAFGRDLAPEDDRPGASPVVLIGHRLWRDRFGSDPNVLGETLKINGTPSQIVGVMPPGMEFPDNHLVWAPWTPFHIEDAKARESRGLTSVVRAPDKGSREAAEAAMTGLAQQLKTEYPDLYASAIAVRLQPFTDQFIGGKAKDMFAIVMGAVTFVLLIACANVANLLLSRAGSRSREIAVRLALGASRWRVVRQLLIESLLLAAVGAGLGLLLAAYGVPFFESSMADSGKPFWLVFTLDGNVVLYVAGVCIATTLLFGLAPALLATRRDSNTALKDSARAVSGSRKARAWSGALVVAELTLSVVLLAGAGLMIQSFYRIQTLDLGFSPQNLFTFGFDLLDDDNFPDDNSIREFIRQVEPRVAAIPGVESAAVTTGVPPRDRMERLLEIDQAGERPEERIDTSVVAITPQFLKTLGVGVLRGRNLEDADGVPGTVAVLVNERFAEKYFPGQNALGRRIRFRSFFEDQPPEPWRTIVGVTPTIRQGSVEDAYLNAVVYTPYLRELDRGAYLLVRSTLPLGMLSDLVRREVQAIESGQPLRPGQTLEQWMASERWPYRVFGGLFAVLASIALTLSTVGLYAVIACHVTQRTQEIGVRMAVGAVPREIAWMVLRRGMRQLAAGLTLGLALAWALSMLMADLLVEVQPGDPATLAAIAVLLAAVSVAACLIPARRAARVDPVAALRME